MSAEPTELEIVKAQLKEQTQQMAEMVSMMKSMMSLAMPLLEEQTRKLHKEKAAEAALKKEREALREARIEDMARFILKLKISHLWKPCMKELQSCVSNRNRDREVARSAESERNSDRYVASRAESESRVAELVAYCQKYRDEIEAKAMKKRLAKLQRRGDLLNYISDK